MMFYGSDCTIKYGKAFYMNFSLLQVQDIANRDKQHVCLCKLYAAKVAKTTFQM